MESTRSQQRDKDLDNHYKTMETQADIIFKNLKILRQVSVELMNYSHAFNMTGNTTMAEILHLLGTDIRDAECAITQARGAESHSTLMESQSNTGFMLGTILDETLKPSK